MSALIADVNDSESIPVKERKHIFQCTLSSLCSQCICFVLCSRTQTDIVALLYKYLNTSINRRWIWSDWRTCSTVQISTKSKVFSLTTIAIQRCLSLFLIIYVDIRKWSTVLNYYENRLAWETGSHRTCVSNSTLMINSTAAGVEPLTITERRRSCLIK